jgi:hypothetical protein
MDIQVVLYYVINTSKSKKPFYVHIFTIISLLIVSLEFFKTH